MNTTLAGCRRGGDFHADNQAVLYSSGHPELQRADVLKSGRALVCTFAHLAVSGRSRPRDIRMPAPRYATRRDPLVPRMAELSSALSIGQSHRSSTTQKCQRRPSLCNPVILSGWISMRSNDWSGAPRTSTIMARIAVAETIAQWRPCISTR